MGQSVYTVGIKNIIKLYPSCFTPIYSITSSFSSRPPTLSEQGSYHSNISSNLAIGWCRLVNSTSDITTGIACDRVVCRLPSLSGWYCLVWGFGSIGFGAGCLRMRLGWTQPPPGSPMCTKQWNPNLRSSSDIYHIAHLGIHHFMWVCPGCCLMCLSKLGPNTRCLFRMLNWIHRNIGLSTHLRGKDLCRWYSYK